MPNPEIEEFARLLVKHVRDHAVQSCDNLLAPHANSPVAKRWREAGSPASIATAIPDCIDDTVFFLLHAIDMGFLRLRFESSNGRVVDLTEEGGSELAGWYMGSGGWRARYSEERFVDDFADLRTWTPPA